MINRLTIVETDCTNVFFNQGIEYFLFNNLQDDEIALFLWTNQKAVVVGRNQDAYSECRIQQLEADSGLLARRLSGGGAVYHDLGNLNFSFIAKANNYSVSINNNIIISALAMLGIDARLSGRNDIEVEGAKISGNAYFKRKDTFLHHGTLLISSILEDVAKYLTPAPSKFFSKTVKSVYSRVTTLSNLGFDLSRNQVVTTLIDSFKNAYPDTYSTMSNACFIDKSKLTEAEQKFSPNTCMIDSCKLTEAEQMFSSKTWRYGNTIAFDKEFDIVFQHEKCKLKINLQNDIIKEVCVDTDSLDECIGDKLRLLLVDKNVNEIFTIVQQREISD